MLFDLRARGRRRTVKVIYLWLAVLMGGGLVLFGIGGATSGGLLDAFNGNGGGGASGANIYAQQVKRAQAQTRARPSDPTAWSQLARAQYLFATTGAGYNPQTGSFTTKATADLRKAAAAWERYLALNPPSADPNVASLMVRAYSAPGGLNDLGHAVDAEQIVAQARPSYGVYAQLAELAYAAGQARTGDLAADKAVALAPKAQQRIVRTRLQAIKAQAQRSAAPGATGGAAGGATTPAPARPAAPTPARPAPAKPAAPTPARP